MSNCQKDCSQCGGCSSCGSCGNSLEMTAGEIEMIQLLAQIPFLPVARRADDMKPVYLEAHDKSQNEYSLILQLLERKGLISLDYDKPLRCFDDGQYAQYPLRGSMALTARGQTVAELLELQGAF